MSPTSHQLPIHKVIPELIATLATHSKVILQAEPGAGKTTFVPVALLAGDTKNKILLNTPLAQKKILMLEPRRLAAQRAASFMAAGLNEKVGETVGYRTRGDSKVSPATKIEVVTEGILTRLLQQDPALSEYGVIIFDEFHERSAQADIGLALCLESQSLLRTDLKLLIMSATLDTERLSAMLSEAPIIKCPGRTFPVVTHHLAPQLNESLPAHIYRAVNLAISESTGDILVFLPGRSEIYRCQRFLEERLNDTHSYLVLTLFAGASEEQLRTVFSSASASKDAVNKQTKKQRKIILATAVAETSLTIDGVDTVIDSGLMRVARYDPSREMDILTTITVTRATADQRRGRAGRQAPGVCYRLWSSHDDQGLLGYNTPEILQTDLVPVALDLANWGTPDISELKLLDYPSEQNYRAAQESLRELGAINSQNTATLHGEKLCKIPLHPRLAQMVLKALEIDSSKRLASIACDVAAVLEEQQGLRSIGSDVDLFALVDALRVVNSKGAIGTFNDQRTNHQKLKSCLEQADRLHRLLGIARSDKNQLSDKDLGLLVMLAYPDRVGKLREGSTSRYLLSGGSGAELPSGSRLIGSRYLAVANLEGSNANARIFLAEKLEEEDILRYMADNICQQVEVEFDQTKLLVTAKSKKMLGQLALAVERVTPDISLIQKTLKDVLIKHGLKILPWDETALTFCQRSEWVRANLGGLLGASKDAATMSWPDLSEDSLLHHLDTWFIPFIVSPLLKDFNLVEALRSLFTREQLQELELLAPSRIGLPSGSSTKVDYAKELPTISVKLQEMLGQKTTPTVGKGRVPVVVELLSPAQRPLQITRDLPSFWANSYRQVRIEMQSRYPKHHWPEDPLKATPSANSRKRG